jgi:hypothetical protein
VAAVKKSRATTQPSYKQGVAEGWREESQDLEDWAKEVNKKLYKAHASQRPALAQQLSQLEHKHFGWKN